MQTGHFHYSQTMLKVSSFLCKQLLQNVTFPSLGLYAPQAMQVARKELAWECDYLREAECARRFQKLIGDSDPVFYVPEVITELTTKRVLTTELVSGISLDKVEDLDQDTKNYVSQGHCFIVLIMFSQ